MLNELTFKDIDNLLIRGDLKFYNFYNTDLDISNVLSTNHYLENSDDNHEADQVMDTVFVDIEVYHEDKSIKFDFNKSDHPINAITAFDSKSNLFTSFILLRPINNNLFNNDKNYYLNYLNENNYIVDNCDIIIYTYTDEQLLIDNFCKYVRQVDPLTLSGFNSDNFDYPYIYRRMLKFWSKEEVASKLSRFSSVEFRNERVKIPDYPICDLLYLYKPRDEGGLALGKKLPSYSLDTISEIELGINKLDYKNQVTDFASFYEINPTDFLLYNIIDVVLCVLLNNKLRHIELYNTLRRIMKVPFSNAMIGSSALFEGYTLYRLSQNNKKVRHGLVTQNNKNIEESDLKGLPKPNTKKNEIVPLSIKQREYTQLICKFDGAYVKEPVPRILHGTIIDLDASSLYPSKILESNIGFDTYKARILPVNTYKMLQQLELHLGIKELPSTMYLNIFQLIEAYITNNKKKITNQLKFKKQSYYIIMFLLRKIVESGFQTKDIFEPKTDEQCYILSFYLLPLLDLLNTLHPNKQVFNSFIYDIVFKNENDIKQNYPLLYVLDNAGNSNMCIRKLNFDDTIQFLNKYSYTICGTCFDKHEYNIGIYSDMLKTLSSLRKSFRAKLKDFPKGSKEYMFFDSRQKAVKIAANSSYGVYGLSSFRYSNHWLAQSITSQGRLTLKLSQYLTETYIKQHFTE